MDNTIPGSLPAGAFAVETDRKIQQTIKKVKLFEQAAKELSRRRYEKYMRLSVSSSCILCSDSAYPVLAGIVREQAAKFDLTVPDVYICQSTEIIYRLIGEEKPFLLFSTQALETFSEKEMAVLVAMKLSHIHCGHEQFLMAIDLLNSAADNMGILKGTIAPIRALLAEWEQIANQSCDRGALLATNDLETVLNVLAKLSGGGVLSFGGCGYESLLEQYKAWQAISDDTPTCPLFKTWSNLYVGSQRYVIRAGLIDVWSKSSEFKTLAGGEVPNMPQTQKEEEEEDGKDDSVLNNWGQFSGNNNIWETPEITEDVIFGAAGLEHQLRRIFSNTTDFFEKGFRQGAGYASQAAQSISDILGKFASK